MGVEQCPMSARHVISTQKPYFHFNFKLFIENKVRHNGSVSYFVVFMRKNPKIMYLAHMIIPLPFFSIESMQHCRGMYILLGYNDITIMLKSEHMRNALIA